MNADTTILQTSLRNKIVLMALAIALIASLALGVATHRRSVSLAEDLGAAKLAGETRLVASQLTDAVRDMRADATIIASTPPIRGIIRAQNAGGIDPTDGSTLSLWKRRLSTIFTSILEARPVYTQIRYIGLSDDGRELVRVNRTEHGFEPVPEDRLQQKGNRTYFKLAQGLELGEWTYSEVDYNREFGRIENPEIPTIRVLLPIFDKEGNRFGMIVINADYEALLRQAIKDADPQSYTIVANANGDFMTYDPKDGSTEFSFHLRDDYALPAPLHADATADGRGLIAIGEYFFYSFKSVIDLARGNLVLNVLTREPKQSVLAPANQANRESLLLSLAILILTSLAALFLARRLTRPLKEMTQEVGRLGQGETELSLPVDQPDEIGALARAFHEVTGALVESEEKIRAIINDIADGLIVTDAEGRIQMFNPACEALFGYSAADAIGKDVALLLPGGLAAGLRSGNSEVTARRRDGSNFDAELSVSLVAVEEGELYCGIVRDISERKKMERMKNEFVSTVNHEIRTPLTSISGALSLLQAKAASQLDAKSTRLLELAQTGTERLGRLVNDILDVEKIEAGKVDYRMEPTELAPLAEAIVARQEPLAERQGVRFVIENSAEGAVVNVDPDRFEQAIVNLLSNAARYSKPGDTVRVAIGRLGPEQIRIAVTDQGPGIPEKFQPRVFDRFAQGDLSGTRKGASSGLGLYITKTLVEAFGGTIGFETEQGRGTQFFIDLPLAGISAKEERKSA
ncbi:ATP-binding protein [Methyloligella sp. 2.7D]|uniref:ATP-binding protein n=1 Tax=unclassified Methyloligella TaxID=2625955 RepID=UPI00157CC46A|nr:ATP-binding protein [Methyloligella sp. GL2]QKP76113.1 PAS domain S-box protein [Methyloligella sp. GL2]